MAGLRPARPAEPVVGHGGAAALAAVEVVFRQWLRGVTPSSDPCSPTRHTPPPPLEHPLPLTQLSGRRSGLTGRLPAVFSRKRPPLFSFLSPVKTTTSPYPPFCSFWIYGPPPPPRTGGGAAAIPSREGYERERLRREGTAGRSLGPAVGSFNRRSMSLFGKLTGFGFNLVRVRVSFGDSRSRKRDGDSDHRSVCLSGGPRHYPMGFTVGGSTVRLLGVLWLGSVSSMWIKTSGQFGSFGPAASRVQIGYG
ncbi:hypothetical protein Hdeb2414_s0024g00645291 [Helianthus debilis subsp. tardiflorus]